MANFEETPNVCGLRREDFQTTVNGKKTDLFVLRNSKGNEVAITNYGGAIVALMVPDKTAIWATSSWDTTIFKMSSTRPNHIYQG